MDVELLTVFNALINLRDNLDARPHILGSELDFLSFATRMASYSNAQLLQDLWVLYELQEKRNGYFVEFGACDGVSLSNTLLLEKTYAWQGALAEPARAWHAALQRNRSARLSLDLLDNLMSGISDMVLARKLLERNAQHWARSESMRDAGLNKQMLHDTRAINRSFSTFIEGGSTKMPTTSRGRACFSCSAP